MNLRGLAVLLFILVSLSSIVGAVSMSGPSGLSNETTTITGDGKVLTFMVRGDSANSQQVDFFVKSSTDIVDIDGDGMSFTKQYTLGQYQTINPVVTMKGVKSGNATITYGVRYRPATNGSGIGFDQVLQDTFKIAVDCSTGVVCRGVNYTVVVKTDPVGANVYVDGVYKGVSPLNMTMRPDTYRFTAKLEGYYDESVMRTVDGNESFTIYLAKVVAVTKKSGGGGGGGGYVPPKSVNKANSTVVATATVESTVDPPKKESSGGESATPVSTQAQASQVTQQVESQLLPSVAAPVSLPEVIKPVVETAKNVVVRQGRGVLLLLLGFLLFMLVLNYSAVRVAKGADFL